jgi:hypothetical protein
MNAALTEMAWTTVFMGGRDEPGHDGIGMIRSKTDVSYGVDGPAPPEASAHLGSELSTS